MKNIAKLFLLVNLVTINSSYAVLILYDSDGAKTGANAAELGVGVTNSVPDDGTNMLLNGTQIPLDQMENKFKEEEKKSWGKTSALNGKVDAKPLISPDQIAQEDAIANSIPKNSDNNPTVQRLKTNADKLEIVMNLEKQRIVNDQALQRANTVKSLAQIQESINTLMNQQFALLQESENKKIMDTAYKNIKKTEKLEKARTLTTLTRLNVNNSTD